MKISIEGFDQSRAVELGLCVADVLVGKNVSKKYAVSSLYSTLKAMAL